MAFSSHDSVTWNGTTSQDTVTWDDFAAITGSGAVTVAPAVTSSGKRNHYDLGTGDIAFPTIIASGSGVRNAVATKTGTGAVTALPVAVGTGIRRHFGTSTAAVVPVASGTGTKSGAATHIASGAAIVIPSALGAAIRRHFGTGAVQPVIVVTNTRAALPFSGIPPGKGASNVDGDEELSRRIAMYHRQKMVKKCDDDVCDALEMLLKIL